jgi:hypothetical protein
MPVTKNPLNWSENPIAFTRCSYYIVTLVRNAIEIFSLLDQRLVQKVPLPLGGLQALLAHSAGAAAAPAAQNRRRSIFDSALSMVSSAVTNLASSVASSASASSSAGQFVAVAMHGDDSVVLVASEHQVYRLTPTPIEAQVQNYLENVQVPEALALLYKAHPSPQQVRQFHAQAGFVLLADLQFEDALSHFQLSMLDPREILALFPHLRLQSLPYTPSHPNHPVHWLHGAMAAASMSSSSSSSDEHADITGLIQLGRISRKKRSDEAREHKVRLFLSAVLKTAIDVPDCLK